MDLGMTNKLAQPRRRILLARKCPIMGMGLSSKFPMNRSVWRADLALAFNTLIWGSTFVLVKRALDDASALLFVAIRFTLASIVMAWLFRRRWTWQSGPPPGGVLAGICLFGGYAFQTT